MPPTDDNLTPEIRTLTIAQAVERYAAGADLPAREIDGLSPAQLQSFPVPGTWSIQQIAVHLMDSDLVASYRMRRTIAEARPMLDCYDESAFAAKLGYHDTPAADAAELFRRNRILTAALLRRQPAESFRRPAVHPEHGEITLETLLRTYVWHLEHHLRFMRDKRRMILGR